MAACAPTPQPTAAPATAAVPTAPKPTAPPTTAQATKISIAYSNLIADSLPLWVARESGIFARNGLDVDLQYIASSNAFAALLASQGQAASRGGSAGIHGPAHRAAAGVVGQLRPHHPHLLEAPPRIKTAADLNRPANTRSNP